MAYLSLRTRDLASAEGALNDGVKALTAWPGVGVSQNPEAWLLTAARHARVAASRYQEVIAASEPTLLLLKETPRRCDVDRVSR